MPDLKSLDLKIEDPQFGKGFYATDLNAVISAMESTVVDVVENGSDEDHVRSAKLNYLRDQLNNLRNVVYDLTAEINQELETLGFDPSQDQDEFYGGGIEGDYGDEEEIEDSDSESSSSVYDGEKDEDEDEDDRDWSEGPAR